VVKEAGSRVIPCAPNKVMASQVIALKPGGAHLPIGFQTVSMTAMKRALAKVDGLFPDNAVDGEGLVRVSTDMVIQALDLIEGTFEFHPGYSFDWEACRAAVEYYSRIAPEGNDKGYCWVAAKTGRTLGRMRGDGLRFSNAPHTYQDRALVKTRDGDLPVILFFRQEGKAEDGWRDSPFWWPVLFAPANGKGSVFASSVRLDEPDPEEEDSA
jgi:hypothetical protein